MIRDKAYWQEVPGAYLVTPLGNVYFLRDGADFAYLEYKAKTDRVNPISDRLTAYKFHRIAEQPGAVVFVGTIFKPVRI